MIRFEEIAAQRPDTEGLAAEYAALNGQLDRGDLSGALAAWDRGPDPCSITASICRIAPWDSWRTAVMAQRRGWPWAASAARIWGTRGPLWRCSGSSRKASFTSGTGRTGPHRAHLPGQP